MATCPGCGQDHGDHGPNGEPVDQADHDAAVSAMREAGPVTVLTIGPAVRRVGDGWAVDPDADALAAVLVSRDPERATDAPDMADHTVPEITAALMAQASADMATSASLYKRFRGDRDAAAQYLRDQARAAGVDLGPDDGPDEYRPGGYL